MDFDFYGICSAVVFCITIGVYTPINLYYVFQIWKHRNHIVLTKRYISMSFQQIACILLAQITLSVFYCVYSFGGFNSHPLSFRFTITYIYTFFLMGMIWIGVWRFWHLFFGM